MGCKSQNWISKVVVGLSLATLICGCQKLGSPSIGSEFVESSVQYQSGTSTVEVYKRDFEIDNLENQVGVFQNRRVAYQIIEGQSVLEGDILMGPVQDSEVAAILGVGKTGSGLWNGGKVPYAIHSSITETTRIIAAVNHWNTVLAGVITIVPRTTESDYVLFTNSTGCSSYIGKIGGAQAIYLADVCSTGNAIHELGHAIGLFHEQSRSDRDQYVTINWGNISSGYSSNFNIVSGSGVSDLQAYDYGSIMHYGAYSFSSNGQPTIVTVQPGIYIGQRSGLSNGDIQSVATMYSSASTSQGPSPAPVATVKGFVDSVVMTKTVQRTTWQGVATVRILDVNGQPVSSASVTVNWSGLVTGVASSITDSQGIAVFRSPKSKSLQGTITATVIGVSGGALIYEPGLNKVDSASVSR